MSDNRHVKGGTSNNGFDPAALMPCALQMTMKDDVSRVERFQ